MRLRAPTLADLHDTYAVLQARDTADLGAPDFTVGDLHDAWQRTETDLAADVRVVEDDTARIVGYGIVEDQGALGLIHPDAEGRGAGSLLLAWLMERERGRGQPVHRQWTNSTNHSAASLLTAQGFELARSSYRMVRPLAGGIGARDPQGVMLRPLEPSDLEVVHALDQRAFADAADYVPESLTSFREEHLEAHDAAPELSRVALDGDRVVGFLIARRWEDASAGYVDILAVDPAHQGQGIGRALLLDAFANFAGVGLDEAQLGVSSLNPKGLNLYKGVGMTIRFRADIYERPISPSPEKARR